MARLALLLLLLALAVPAAAQRDPRFYLGPGGTLRVTLQENVTTGYSWILAESSQTRILEVQKDQQVKPGGGRVGQPGFHVFPFKCKGEGKARLHFEYRRPWEREADPVRTFSVDVEGTKQTSPTEVLSEAVYVQPGSRFEVSLPAAGSPGNAWGKPSVAQPSVVQLVDWQARSSPSGPMGTPDLAVLVFEALRPGRSLVTAAFAPAEGPPAEPARSLNLQVTVAR